MKIIFIRSPYFIEIEETGQVGSKVELFIWNEGSGEPAFPTYTLSKKVPSPDQIRNIYNISNYAKEFINIETPPYSFAEPDVVNDNNWCYVKVKRYKETSASNYTLLDTETLIALNGYTNYTDGYNNYKEDDFITLNKYQENKVYKLKLPNTKQYLTFYINYTDNTIPVGVRYTNLANNYTTEQYIFDGSGGTEKGYIIRVPITELISQYENGNKVEIIYNIDDDLEAEILASYTFIYECEPKYTPVVCYYINSNGVWDYITFFKARVDNWEVKNKEYQLLPDDLDYNTARGQGKFFNFEAKQSVKLNTGWVEEYYNDLIKDLMTSEIILLDDKPVKLKTMSTDLKTSLQDKMINYQIEFEYNYNQINNVI